MTNAETKYLKLFIEHGPLNIRDLRSMTSPHRYGGYEGCSALGGISKCLYRMTDKGLLIRQGFGTYAISDTGRAILAETATT